jgi:hypothetical protein
MEDFLQKLLSKLTFLNVKGALARAEFANHIGWGFTIPLFLYWVAGDIAFNVGIVSWFAYTLYKELIVDEHLVLRLRKTETAAYSKDMWTDLISRLLPVVVLITIQIWKKT